MLRWWAQWWEWLTFSGHHLPISFVCTQNSSSWYKCWWPSATQQDSLAKAGSSAPMVHPEGNCCFVATAAGPEGPPPRRWEEWISWLSSLVQLHIWMNGIATGQARLTLWPDDSCLLLLFGNLGCLKKTYRETVHTTRQCKNRLRWQKCIPFGWRAVVVAILNILRSIYNHPKFWYMMIHIFLMKFSLTGPLWILIEYHCSQASWHWASLAEDHIDSGNRAAQHLCVSHCWQNASLCLPHSKHSQCQLPIQFCRWLSHSTQYSTEKDLSEFSQ